MADEPLMIHPATLRRALEAVRTSGAAYIPDALNPTFRRHLQAQLDLAPFERLPDRIGPVRQQAELFVTRGTMSNLPAVASLRRHLVAQLRPHVDAIPALADWWPNEAYVQRYAPGSSGVSSHMDSAHFVHLVAVFTTQGAATFTLSRHRSGEALSEWEANPGSLILIRGHSPGQQSDRPFHRVGGPAHHTRFSVTLRMNTRSHSD
jgi:hypothetical protein